ncbi:MAG: AAA family ATPase [Pirellulaceae bacterium]
MKVKNLQVDGFGVWTALGLQALSHRVTVVFGANETGKTTLLQFIRSMLYGFSPDRRARYLPPVHGGRAGGWLDVDATTGGLQIHRHLERFATPEEVEELVVRSAAGANLSVTLLDHLLAGVDEATFSNVFAVGLRELQELGTLDDTKAADLLYKLTTGLDRVSLIDVMRDLGAVRRKLLDPGDESSSILDLVARRDQLHQRMEALADEGRQWVDLQSQLAALDEQTLEWQHRLGEWDEQVKVLEVALRVRELWCRRSDLHQQLDAIGELREVPDTSLQRMETLRGLIDENEREVAQLERRRREFRREAAAQPVNEALWSQAARIEALVEMGPWIASLQTQVDQMRAEMNGMQVRLSVSTSQLGLGQDAAGRQLPELDHRTLAALQGPARAVREESQRLKQAQADHEAARLQLEELTTRLETALVERGQEDLAQAVEGAGTSVNRLRRRVQLDERVDQMTRQWTDLQADHRELLEEQVLAPGTLVWLGVPFVVGISLLVGGMVWAHAAMLGWPMAVLGLASCLVAVVAKIGMERAAAGELEHCESQLQLLKSQIQESRQEREELDAELPRRGGALDVRLAAAEQDLAGLEELLPLEANLQAARQRVVTTQRRAEQLEESLKESRTRWRAALRRLNLPEDMSPPAVKQLAEGTQQTLHSRRQLDIRREEYEARERELTTLITRLNQLVEQVQLNYSSPDPQVQLQRLAAALAEQQTLFDRRQQLRQEDRQTRRQARTLTHELKKARAERRSIMAAAGARNEQELRQLLERLAQRRALQAELRDVSNQFTLALGKNAPLARVEQELVAHCEAELEQMRSNLTRQTDEVRAQLAHIHQRRGALEQQSQGLVADRRRPELKLQLGCVDQQLDEAVHRWRVLSVATRVLELVREIYETQRQPQTLQDASRYFTALTEGQYVRIWTPLTDMSLRVDLATGESLPLDVLSSGTREAVFLSLRLALVADFSRRGIVLPLILDDVLVNFDRLRARNAAHVLLDFADRGHQVVLFTCHEHIVELFTGAQVEIRYLSDFVPSQLAMVATPQPPQVNDVPAVELEPEPVPELDEQSEPEEEPELELEEVEDAVEPDAVIDEDYGLADPVDPPDDKDYELGDPAYVVPALPLEFFLKPDEPCSEIVVVEQQQEEAAYDEIQCFPEAVDEESDEEVVEQTTPVARPRIQPRFAWESPERWWDGKRGDEAA